MLLAAGAVDPDDSDLCGIKILPELWAGTAWKWKDEPFVGEPFRYCPAKVTSGGSVQVLAQTASGNPLITCHKIGKGLVYTCLAPWFEGTAAMAGAAARMFDKVIGSVQKVTIEGLPIHWTNSVRNEEIFVTLSNSSEAERKGRVRLPACARQIAGSC